jgi:tRNA(Ile)-lysidine synthase
MNADENFARVRARRKLIPLLETFNPRAVEALTRTAALVRDDNDVLREQATKLLGAARSPNAPNTVRASLLRDAPPALRRRALRQWIAEAKGDLKRLTLAHLLAVEKLLGGEQGGRIAELPGKLEIERRKDYLHLKVLKKVEKGDGQNYNP